MHLLHLFVCRVVVHSALHSRDGKSSVVLCTRTTHLLFIRIIKMFSRYSSYNKFLRLSNSVKNTLNSAKNKVPPIGNIHQCHLRRVLTRPVLVKSALAALVIGKMSDGIKGVSQSTFDQADKLFDDAKYPELLELLKQQPNWEENEQVLWRVARCEFQIAKSIKDKKSEHEQLVNTAYEHVKKSLELDDKNGLAHKWAAILLDAVSTLKGTKERVLQVLNVRNHMEKAVEYAPTDPTSYYLLGEWHFSCYQVSWWERKLASIAFGKLPDADMDVALKMFEKAEEIEKDFYSKNKIMLAKTLLELKRDKDRTIQLLEDVVSKYSSSDKWDDKEAVEEASKLLSQHK